MTHHAAFLLGLHCLPIFIFKCEKMMRGYPQFHTLCLIAATALTRLCVCAGLSDHSLLVNAISTHISDIINTLTVVNEFHLCMGESRKFCQRGSKFDKFFF